MQVPVQQRQKGGSNYNMHVLGLTMKLRGHTMTQMYITAATSLLREELLEEVPRIDLSSWILLNKPQISIG